MCRSNKVLGIANWLHYPVDMSHTNNWCVSQHQPSTPYLRISSPEKSTSYINGRHVFLKKTVHSCTPHAHCVAGNAVLCSAARLLLIQTISLRPFTKAISESVCHRESFQSTDSNTTAAPLRSNRLEASTFGPPTHIANPTFAARKPALVAADNVHRLHVLQTASATSICCADGYDCHAVENSGSHGREWVAEERGDSASAKVHSAWWQFRKRFEALWLEQVLSFRIFNENDENNNPLYIESFQRNVWMKP